MELGEIRLSNPSHAPDNVAAPAGSPHVGKAQRDIVALGIAAAAIIMFIGAGGKVLPQIAQSWLGHAQAPDAMLTNALLLNIALIIFGWRRYADLTREVGERRRAEEQAFVLALTDPLTGCLNRRSVGPATDKLLAVAQARGHAVAFLLFDLDNFKTINDMNGHVAGDALLKQTAQRVGALLPPESKEAPSPYGALEIIQPLAVV